MTDRGLSTLREIEAEWRELQRAWTALAAELDPVTRHQLETRLWQPLTQRMEFTTRSVDAGLSRARQALMDTRRFDLDSE